LSEEPDALHIGKGDWLSFAGAIVGLLGYILLRGGCVSFLIVKPCDVVASVLGILLGITAFAMIVLGRIIERRARS
jgi:hypothetical protein